MGLIVCPKHGNGFMFVCPHVAEAARDGRPCRGIQRLVYTDANPELAGIELACWFCPSCVEARHLPASGTTIANGDAFLDGTSALYQPMCPGCFQDWQARSGG